jgi:hypothetical protein
MEFITNMNFPNGRDSAQEFSLSAFHTKRRGVFLNLVIILPPVP